MEDFGLLMILSLVLIIGYVLSGNVDKMLEEMRNNKK
jgi:hypothetical protein